MGALPFIATGFFNILHLSEKAHSQLPIHHHGDTFEKCPSSGSQSFRLQCLLHVNIYPQQRNANAKVQAQAKAFPGKDEVFVIIDTYSRLKLHFNVVSIPTFTPLIWVSLTWLKMDTTKASI